MTYTLVDQLTENLNRLISEIGNAQPDAYFFLKPHPRDTNMEFDFLKGRLPDGSWELPPRSFWSQPLEVLSSSIKPELVLTGWSTVGINADFFPNARIMVFDFLSIDLNYYNKDTYRLLLNVLEKSGTYSGQTVEEAVEKTLAYLHRKKE
jgi:hypothetical protein